VTDEQEREVAGRVARLVQSEYNEVPGLPTERDGRDGSGLTVDFTYDEADPPSRWDYRISPNGCGNR
jgi:hypothetical protein